MPRSPVRHALLHTLAGRVVVVGIAMRLAVYLAGRTSGGISGFLNVIDTVASLALAAAVAYFVVRLLLVAKRRLLWRVRRKLILSYVFIGFVPAMLIVAFFLLCGFLLFYNVSSYLVQSRLRAFADRARVLAQSTALEIQRSGGRDVERIIAARQVNAAAEFPGASLVVVRADRMCRTATDTNEPPAPAVAPAAAGPWAHVAPPSTVPQWIDCAGFAGVLATSNGPSASAAKSDRILVRAVAFPERSRPTFAVIADLPVDRVVSEQVHQETGVEITGVGADRAAGSVEPLTPRAGGEPATARPDAIGVLSNLPSVVTYRDWTSGASGTLNLSTEFRVGELYDRISSTQGLNFGQALLFVLFIIGGLFVVIEIVALAAGLALAKSITGSVHELFTGTERVRQGDFTHKIDVKAPDQLGELAESFNSMTASIEDLLREAAEKKRLEEELRIAREIQMSLLPQGPLVIPGLSVSAVCVPAREVGGDYYDFFRLDDRRVGVLIADVSGKGTSAALYMAELKGLVLSLSQIHRSPRDLLMAANRIIAHNLDARSFITMTYAVLDLQARTMTYARAGHTPLIYVPALETGATGSRQVRVLVPDGLVVGLKIDDGELFDRLLVEETLPLIAGDLYLFFTDGVTEAMNAGDDFFGEGRLGRILEEHADLPADELRERVLREIEAFVGAAPQHDDMTMILLKVEKIAPLTPAVERTAEILEVR